MKILHIISKFPLLTFILHAHWVAIMNLKFKIILLKKNLFKIKISSLSDRGQDK